MSDLTGVKVGDVLRWRAEPFHEWTYESVVKTTKAYVVTEGEGYKGNLVYRYWRKSDGYMRGVRPSSSFPTPHAEPEVKKC